MPKVTQDEIRLAYRYLLGRDPESGINLETAASHFRDIDHLRTEMLSSPEAASTLFDSIAGPLKGLWICMATSFGRQIFICLSDTGVSKTILLSGSWEPHVGRQVLSLLNAGDTFIDVGANIGWFSLLAADHLARLGSGNVISIEANPHIVKRLSASIVASGLDHVIDLRPYAVSDRVDIVQMSASEAGNVGGLSIVPFTTGEIMERRSVVPCLPLDVMLTDVKRCDLVKMDIEGAEFRAMQGFEKVLARFTPKIIMEINKEALRWVSGVCIDQLLELMSDYGYSAFGPVGGALQPLGNDEINLELNHRGYWDVLFQRSC